MAEALVRGMVRYVCFISNQCPLYGIHLKTVGIDGHFFKKMVFRKRSMLQFEVQ